ncbi:ATP binding protein [Aureococcus anophagefferens]|nr:ATP binding protein [Aureococcus anophagefferens]
MAPKVPVTILTGLGSGKTTLLNHILTAKHDKKIAVIENEFGDVGIDDALLKPNLQSTTDEDVIEMMNGCICCTVRQDLVEVLKKLARRSEKGLKLDAIVIETTGLADPAPVAQTFFVDDDVKAFCELDGIVTLVDAKHVVQHLDDEKPEGAENEAVEQVAFADRLILNKVDLVDGAELDEVERRLRDINKFAPVLRSEQSKHEHDATVTSVGISVDGAVDLDKFNAWLGPLVEEKGVDIYRMKGVVAIDGNDDKYVYHAVHMIFTGAYSDPWGDEPRSCKLMFIGKNLDKDGLARGFEECRVPDKSKKRRTS